MGDKKMKKKGFLIAIMLAIATVVPLLVLTAQATLSAGPDQTKYTSQTVILNGSTTDNASLIIQVTWDFGDNTTVVNGSSPSLLTTTHIYTVVGVYNATLTVKFDAPLNKTDTAKATITVLVNQPPIANAGPDQFVEQTSLQGANATLNGSGSSDPNNDTLTYNWNWTGGSATGVGPTALFPPGNTTVTLMVSDGQLNATDMVNIIVRDTTPPFVDAGPNVTVEAGTPVTLNGTAIDAVSTRFNFTWSENGVVLKTQANATNTSLTNTFSFGTHIVMLNATDQAGNMGSANVTVKVTDTTPPVVNVSPQNVTVEAGTLATLNGTATDNVSTRFNFTWSENGVVLKTQANATNTSLVYDTKFKVGTHFIILNAMDEAGNTGAANVTINVIDTTPPVITATVMPSTLWPPNHKYVDVTVNVTVADLGDPAPKITLVSFGSNEPDNAKGDGNTISDIVKVDDFTFTIRAERSGTGSGRTYIITYKATDASGNSAMASVTVEVPHNQ
jgi:hypothetical protein